MRTQLIIACMVIHCIACRGQLPEISVINKIMTDNTVLVKKSGNNRTTPTQKDSIVPTRSTIQDSLPTTLISFEEAIELYGFSKDQTSKSETFLLRNKTPYTITRVVLRLIYKTPAGEMINNRTVSLETNMSPKSTKYFDIESFNKTQRYFYHTSMVDSRNKGYPFIVNYELEQYDIAMFKPQH